MSKHSLCICNCRVKHYMSLWAALNSVWKYLNAIQMQLLCFLCIAKSNFVNTDFICLITAKMSSWLIKRKKLTQKMKKKCFIKVKNAHKRLKSISTYWKRLICYMTIGNISWNTSNWSCFCFICCQEDTPEDGSSIVPSLFKVKHLNQGNLSGISFFLLFKKRNTTVSYQTEPWILQTITPLI